MRKIESISVVIPAYRQEKTIASDINNLRKILDDLPYEYELIIVCDGIVDKTYQVAKKRASKKIKILGYENNRGKGYAVRHGMLQGKGDIIGFIDAGMDIDPSGISMLLNHMIWYDADIVIGSKLHPVSQVYYPFPRRVLSLGYRLLVRVLFDLNVKDTQVGLKFFRKKVVKDVFPKLLVKKFAFDIETLAIAHAYGYKKIYEAPVKLDFRGANTITNQNFWKIILHMLWDTSAVFYRLKIIKYYQNRK